MKTIKIIIWLIIILIFVLVLVAIAGIIRFRVLGSDIYLAQMDNSTIRANDIISKNSFVFVCEDDAVGQFDIIKLKRSKSKYFFNIDATSQEIFQIPSASGEKYESKNKSLVFWTKGNNAFVEKNGTIIHKSCVLNKNSILFQIPLKNKKVNFIGKKEETQIASDYTDDLERGTITLFVDKQTIVSKVSNKPQDTYVIIPYVVITQGTGHFFSVALFSINSNVPNIYKYIDDYYLGDRIQDIHIEDQIGMVGISYKDYAAQQAFSEDPTEEKMIHLSISKEGMNFYKEK